MRGLAADDAATPTLRVWAGYDEMERGHFDAARQLTTGIDADRIEPEDRFVLDLAAAIGAMGDPADGRRLRFPRARRALDEAVRRSPRFASKPILSRTYRRTIARIAAMMGGWHSWVWRSYLWVIRAT